MLNVGTGPATLARDVAGQLFELSGQPEKIVDEAAVLGARWQQADIGLIERQLGWFPKISLSDSLAESWSEPAEVATLG